MQETEKPRVSVCRPMVSLSVCSSDGGSSSVYAATGNSDACRRRGNWRHSQRCAISCGRRVYDGDGTGRWTARLCIGGQQSGGGEAIARQKGEGIVIVVPAIEAVHILIRLADSGMEENAETPSVGAEI